MYYKNIIHDFKPNSKAINTNKKIADDFEKKIVKHAKSETLKKLFEAFDNFNSKKSIFTVFFF